MFWKTAVRTFDLTQRALVMGIVNVTSDSFSDGGQYLNRDRAVEHALQLAEEGAEILDIGGESTRPGAEPVAESEELRRVLPVIKALVERTQVAISIDTMKPAVAQAALECGAAIVNDVTGLRNPEMREVVRGRQAGALAMHMQGMPRDMQQNPHYEDLLGEIRDFFRQTYEACLGCGIAPMCLAFDPGIGFGKTVAHNLALIRNLESLRVGARPLALGVSRKSFLSKILDAPALEDRSWPTVALTSYGATRGAQIFRVHEVGSNVEALRMTEAIVGP